VAYDAIVFTPPSPWGVFVTLVPVIGDVLVTFLITNFAPEARGHGVPEVMDAIYTGVVRVNARLSHGLEAAYAGVRFRDMAQRNFTLAREADIMFDVVQRIRRLLVSLIDQERRSGFASHCVVSHDRDSAADAEHPQASKSFQAT